MKEAAREGAGGNERGGGAMRGGGGKTSVPRRRLCDGNVTCKEVMRLRP